MCVCVYETNLVGWPLTLSSEKFVEVQVAPKPVTGIELITCKRAPKPVTPYTLRVPWPVMSWSIKAPPEQKRCLSDKLVVLVMTAATATLLRRPRYR